MMPNEALENVVNYILAHGSLAFAVRLFDNNPSPADEDITLADINEATFSGYIGQNLGTPPAPTQIGGDYWDSVTPTFTWTFSGGTAVTIYGMFLTFQDAATNLRLYGFARFATPIVLTSSGDKVQKKIELATDDLPL